MQYSKNAKLKVGKISIKSIALCIAMSLVACSSFANNKIDKLSFTKVDNFLSDEPNLRKWDLPVIADLDKDGYADLLLNDHGFSIKIIWNNKGKFAKPYDLLMGDAHGIAVNDFNSDGDMDIVIARGGGSGSNARNSVIFTIDSKRNISQHADFDTPLAFMRGRTVKFADLDKDGDADLLNFAFPSKEKKGESENYLYENQNFQTLSLKATLPAIRQNGQKVLITDYQNDGYPDIFMYGHGKLKVFKNTKDFTFVETSSITLPFAIDDVTGIVEIDYDNDGDFDLFVSRGQEFSAGQTFYNQDKKTFAFYTKRKKFNFDLLGVGDVLKIENMQSQWPHKNVFIGESGYDYQFPGETHSGRDIRLVNSDALGFVDLMDKKGTYIGYVGNQNWRLAGDIFSPFSAVIHGVSDAVGNSNGNGPQDFLLENQNGKFVDISDKLMNHENRHTMAAVAGDVNHDGFVDLVLRTRGQMVFENTAVLLINKKGESFDPIANHNVLTNDLGAIGMGLELFDYDNDNDLDILIGDERGKWSLFQNRSTLPPSLEVNVGLSPKNRATNLHALVTFKQCQNLQTRKVGASSSPYSQGFMGKLHFSKVDCNEKGLLSVVWSNGEEMNQKISLDQSKIEWGIF